MADYKKFRTKRDVEGSLTRALVTSAKKHQEIAELEKRLKTAVGGLRSIAYGYAQTWPNCSSREVAKQALLDCGGEKYESLENNGLEVGRTKGSETKINNKGE